MCDNCDTSDEAILTQPLPTNQANAAILKRNAKLVHQNDGLRNRVSKLKREQRVLMMSLDLAWTEASGSVASIEFLPSKEREELQVEIETLKHNLSHREKLLRKLAIQAKHRITILAKDNVTLQEATRVAEERIKNLKTTIMMTMTMMTTTTTTTARRVSTG
jgi:hypothetical protein